MSKKNFITAIVVLFVAVAMALTLISGNGFFSPNKNSVHSESQLKEYAEEVFQKCSSENYRLSCYDKEIPKLMGIITMEDAFQITRYIQEKSPEYLYCHVLGHNIAEHETRRDPSKWKDVVARCPTTMCNNGCPHGALMERFKNTTDSLSDAQIAEIKPDLEDVCEPRGKWNPSEVERSMCYHALGHLNMYISNADLRKSAQLCKEIGTKDGGRSYVQTCTEGVFMSIYQPLGPEDFALIKGITPTKENKVKFCSQYKDDKFSFHACNKEGWALFRQDILTPRGLVSFCSYTDDPVWQDICYRSLMNPITDQTIVDKNDIEWLKNFCGALPGKLKGTCFSASVHRLMQIDPKLTLKALEVCQKASSLGQAVQDACYQSLLDFSRGGFIKNSQQFYEYCNALPELWKGKCLAGVKI